MQLPLILYNWMNYTGSHEFGCSAHLLAQELTGSDTWVNCPRPQVSLTINSWVRIYTFFKIGIFVKKNIGLICELQKKKRIFHSNFLRTSVFVAMVCDKPKNHLASDTTFDVEFIKPLQKV